MTGAGVGPIDLRVDLEEIRDNITAVGGSVDLDTPEKTIFVLGGKFAGVKITYRRLPEPFQAIYPYRDGNDLVWACCESTIGPVCQHRA